MSRQARDDRKYRRGSTNGWTKLGKSSRRYRKWIKSLQNVKVYDEYGFPYYAWNREPLIKNGGKP